MCKARPSAMFTGGEIPCSPAGMAQKQSRSGMDGPGAESLARTIVSLPHRVKQWPLAHSRH